MFRCVPTGAVEIVAVLGQSGEVADAEVAGTRRPVLIVGSRFTEIVIARPHEFTDNPVLVVLPYPVIVGQVAP